MCVFVCVYEEITQSSGTWGGESAIAKMSHIHIIYNCAHEADALIAELV